MSSGNSDPRTVRLADPIATVPLADGASLLPFYSQFPLDRQAKLRKQAEKKKKWIDDTAPVVE